MKHYLFPLVALLVWLLPAARVAAEHQIARALMSRTEVEVEQRLEAMSGPRPPVAALISALNGLSAEEADRALNTLSGQQHADDLITTELLNRQFIRRLYDPLRSLITTEPDPCRHINPYYELMQRNCGMALWGEADGGQIYLDGYQDTYKLTTSGYAVTAGIQKTFAIDWTVGLGGSYEYDRLQYDGHGTGKSKTGFLGLYGLYRPSEWYALLDLAWGYSFNTLNRKIDVGSAHYQTHCNPDINQYTFYGEYGCDLNTVVCIPYVLVQPFIGVEVGTFQRQAISEHSPDEIELHVYSRTRTNTFTRLGLHVTSLPLPHEITVSVDFAWLKRWSNRNNQLTVRFVNFGEPFYVNGEALDKNNVEGALTVSCMLRPNLRIFAEAYGEVGGKYYTYNGLAAIELFW